MVVVQGDRDTVRFANIGVGNAFRKNGVTYLKIIFHHGGVGAVSLETGNVCDVNLDDQVTPVVAKVVVEAVGRVACGYNPK